MEAIATADPDCKRLAAESACVLLSYLHQIGAVSLRRSNAMCSIFGMIVNLMKSGLFTDADVVDWLLISVKDQVLRVPHSDWLAADWNSTVLCMLSQLITTVQPPYDINVLGRSSDRASRQPSFGSPSLEAPMLSRMKSSEEGSHVSADTEGTTQRNRELIETVLLWSAILKGIETSLVEVCASSGGIYDIMQLDRDTSSDDTAATVPIVSHLIAALLTACQHTHNVSVFPLVLPDGGASMSNNPEYEFVSEQLAYACSLVGDFTTWMATKLLQDESYVCFGAALSDGARASLQATAASVVRTGVHLGVRMCLYAKAMEKTLAVGSPLIKTCEAQCFSSKLLLTYFV